MPMLFVTVLVILLVALVRGYVVSKRSDTTFLAKGFFKFKKLPVNVVRIATNSR